MIRCNSCGNDCPAGSQFCDECGSPLKAVKPEAGVESKVEEPQANRGEIRYDSLENAAVISASSTSVGIPFVNNDKDFQSPPISESKPLNSQTVNARLIIERGTEVGKEFPITTSESYIGRWDADNGIFPDVDLDKYDPEAKISRRHARIFFEKNKFLIEDMGSTNGTFVNRGRRLLPGTPHILNDNDEIIIGKTFLRFNIS